jgi:glycosyltransferase involved in cell wall biosynthesis
MNAGEPLPLVTIQVSAYNQASFIGEALASALAQDYANLEVVVCDDASTDGTPQVIERFAGDPRLRRFRNEKNLGRVANYRRLVNELSRGKWIAHLDGDDYFTDPSFVRAAVERGESHPDIVLVFSRILKTADPAHGGRVENPIPPRAPVMDGHDFFYAYPPLELCAPMHLGTLYQRDAACAAGAYIVDIVPTDFDMFYRMMLSGRVAFLGSVTGVYREHGDQVTRSASLGVLVRNAELFDSLYAAMLRSRPNDKPELDRWLRRRLARYFVSRGKILLQEGRVRSLFILTGSLRQRDRWFFLDLPAALRDSVTQRRALMAASAEYLKGKG